MYVCVTNISNETNFNHRCGRSASSLIQYLLDKSKRELHLVIGDLSLALAQRKTNDHKNATAIALDIYDNEQRKAIENAVCH
jgi:hypothetical protein